MQYSRSSEALQREGKDVQELLFKIRLLRLRTVALNQFDSGSRKEQGRRREKEEAGLEWFEGRRFRWKSFRATTEDIAVPRNDSLMLSRLL